MVHLCERNCYSRRVRTRYTRNNNSPGQNPIPSGHPGQSSDAGPQRVPPEKGTQVVPSYVFRGSLHEYVRQCHLPRQ